MFKLISEVYSLQNYIYNVKFRSKNAFYASIWNFNFTPLEMHVYVIAGKLSPGNQLILRSNSRGFSIYFLSHISTLSVREKLSTLSTFCSQ